MHSLADFRLQSGREPPFPLSPGSPDSPHLIRSLVDAETQQARLQVSKSWNPLEVGTCLPSGPSFTGYAVVTIISDIVVALIPIPALLKLNVRLGKKIGLIVIFLLGLFTTVCSIQRYLQIDRIQFGDGNSTMLVLWGTIEFNVGVSETGLL